MHLEFGPLWVGVPTPTYHKRVVIFYYFDTHLGIFTNISSLFENNFKPNQVPSHLPTYIPLHSSTYLLNLALLSPSLSHNIVLLDSGGDSCVESQGVGFQVHGSEYGSFRFFWQIREVWVFSYYCRNTPDTLGELSRKYSFWVEI